MFDYTHYQSFLKNIDLKLVSRFKKSKVTKKFKHFFLNMNLFGNLYKPNKKGDFFKTSLYNRHILLCITNSLF